MIKVTIIRLVALILAAILLQSTAFAQSEDNSSAAVSSTEASQVQELQRAASVRKLLAIKQSLNDKRERLRSLIEQLQNADQIEKENIQKQIAGLRETVEQLTRSFEIIAASGARLNQQADADREPLNWRDELMQIARPLLTSLQEATEKPRRIESLRREIQLLEQQLEVAQNAAESIARFDREVVPELVAVGLDEVAASWNERSKDIQHALEITREELSNLERQDLNLFETIGRAIRDFILGRGLTLLIAILTGGLLWYAMRALREQVSKRRVKSGNRDYAARLRLLLYGYHLLTILLVAMAVLTVFYARGDLLLLSLAIITLIVLALGAWRFLPQYIHEGRLLLNMGAAREGERVVYNGLPFRITSLNLFSRLHNPELEGSIRLPLSSIGELISRPAGNDAWFPCRVGEYLLLADGAFAQVLEQTVERVRLKVVGSIVDYPSAEFMQLNVRNLSREGFGVVVTFGIDYQHQSICLDQVPQKFREGLQSAFSQSDYGEDLKNLVVEFNSAAASSLDYLIYATMEGNSAASYYAISRLIQQTCVDICNQEGWGIPFTQVTIHQADGGLSD